jgi:hypothetical protein
MSFALRFEDLRCFEAWKNTKRYQGAKKEEIQDKIRSHKNRTIQFWIPEFPFSPK